MKIKLIFAWYDIWIGFFWDSKKRCLYFFPFPTCGMVIQFKQKGVNYGQSPITLPLLNKLGFINEEKKIWQHAILCKSLVDGNGFLLIDSRCGDIMARFNHVNTAPQLEALCLVLTGVEYAG